jgi:hypothetical protein
MAIELKETEEIIINNKKSNFWNFLSYTINFISITSFIFIIITLFILINKYDGACDGVKDGVILCYITEK